jgi:hypothetical protein
LFIAATAATCVSCRLIFRRRFVGLIFCNNFDFLFGNGRLGQWLPEQHEQWNQEQMQHDRPCETEGQKLL